MRRQRPLDFKLWLRAYFDVGRVDTGQDRYCSATEPENAPLRRLLVAQLSTQTPSSIDTISKPLESDTERRSMRAILTRRQVVALGLTSGVTSGALVIAWMAIYLPQNQPAFSDAAVHVKPANEIAQPRAMQGSVDKAVTSTVEALTATLGSSRISGADNSEGAPIFDVARIGPNGDAVIAGRVKPRASVELLRDGVVHDKVIADQSGEFVIVPAPLPPGDYRLTLRSTHSDGTISTSKSSVAVSLHFDKTGEPTGLRSKPTAVPSESKRTDIQIIAIESKGGGNLYVVGQSEPGTTVRLYLNGSYITSGTTSAAGRVAFAIESGVMPGDYRVRLDAVDGSAGVRSHVERSFTAPALNAARPLTAAKTVRPGTLSPPVVLDLVAETKPTSSHSTSAPTNDVDQGAQPLALAESASPEIAAPAAIAQSSSEQLPPAPHLNSVGAGQQLSLSEVAPHFSAQPIDRKDIVVVPSIDTAAVRGGDNLWNISRSTYGQGIQYSRIYDANRDQIRDPDLIFPGQIFVLPKAPAGE